MGWAEWAVYALVPIAVIFVLLYRSGWHRELTGAPRTLALIGLSGFIFCSVLIVGGAILTALLVVINHFTSFYP